jgi:hypothetical protein
MTRSAKCESLGGCIRPWRDGRFGTLQARIQRLRLSRTLGPAVRDRPKANVSRHQFSAPWGWFDTIGLMILLSFTALLLRSLLR